MPPVAKIVPHSMTVHGDTRVDNYFWLRDKDDPDTIAYLEAENQYTAGCHEAHRGASGDALRGDAGPHQANRSQRAGQARRLFLLHAHRGREAVCHLLPQATIRSTRPRKFCWTATCWPRASKYFRMGNFCAQPESPSAGVFGRLRRRRNLHDPRQGSGDRRASAGRDPEHLLFARMGATTTRPSSTPCSISAKRPLQDLPPRAGRARRRAGLPRAGRALHGRARENLQPRLYSDQHRQPADYGGALSPADQPARRFHGASAARAGHRIRRDPSRRFLLHPHQRWREDISRGGGARSRSLRSRIGRRSFRRAPTSPSKA